MRRDYHTGRRNGQRSVRAIRRRPARHRKPLRLHWVSMSDEVPSAHSTDSKLSPRRGRGRPPRISREQIVAAARAVPREDLTMKAVADAMGVSRKALHYHVTDREGLLTLMVAELLEYELGTIRLPANAEWQTVLRAYARAMHASIVRVGVAPTYIQLRGLSASAALALTERVVEPLFTAGFDDCLARRALTVMSNTALTYAHIEILLAQHGIHPQEAEVTRALQQAQDQFPYVRRVVASASTERLGDTKQFEFEVELAIVGLEHVLATTSREGA